MKLDSDRDITNTYRNDTKTYGYLNFTTASVNDNSNKWALDSLLKKGVQKGLLHDSDRDYFQIFSVAGSSNQVAFNCPRFENYKNNPFMASLELINARKAIWRIYNFVKQMFPGFENAEIVNIASQTGVREVRRVKTKYVYKDDDLLNAKQFSSPVLQANYSIDVHSDSNKNIAVKKVSVYELPIESLMSYDIENLFVIGKIVGAEFRAHSAIRVQKSCMQMGEAVAKHISSELI